MNTREEIVEQIKESLRKAKITEATAGEVILVTHLPPIIGLLIDVRDLMEEQNKKLEEIRCGVIDLEPKESLECNCHEEAERRRFNTGMVGLTRWWICPVHGYIDRG